MREMELSKTDLRARALALRRDLSRSEIKAKSEDIAKRLLESSVWKAAGSVWIYVSLPDEVQTFSLFEAAWLEGKETAAPKVTEQGMVFGVISSFEELEEGRFHILEPKAVLPARDPKALIVLPGAAFDKEGNRIGYGAGYYDRYLAEHPGHPTAGLTFDLTLFPSICREEHDRKPDLVITETQYIRTLNLAQ